MKQKNSTNKKKKPRQRQKPAQKRESGKGLAGVMLGISICMLVMMIFIYLLLHYVGQKTETGKAGKKKMENKNYINQKDSMEQKNSIEQKEEQEQCQEPDKKRELGKKIAKEILGTGVYLLVVLLSIYLIIHYVGQRTEVIGQSMEPTLQDGDNLIVDKISYRFHEPQRFDVIVFPFRYAEGTYYIKRIIGMPGETVRIDWDGNIYIDGELLPDNYGKEVIENPGRAENEILLGEDEYFVMGDNRNNSTDSRADMVGNLRRNEIIGRAWVRIYPFSGFGKLSNQKG